MRTKRMRNRMLGLMFTAMTMMTIGISSSYNGFVEAKSTCIESNGIITKENLELLAVNWSISCEQ
ncbi:hypothetical protein HUG15_08535 [Salicibibacter cibarius]|uniref:Uncharacterized protein n=1 Tax=Salicibibacter cibarius TaxID=2743000 RepID=A0A7T7CBA4_9BACI|nr:hypothetical protein [Salicibibacter cibarius]QQK75604.1 hypothetical protein HUG15_08535 [Salicibibacter cibarius]